MITVAILINGYPLYTRTAVNRIPSQGGYRMDDGSIIKHNPKDGAVKLAIKMLKSIHEEKSLNDPKREAIEIMQNQRLKHYCSGKSKIAK